MILLNRIKYKTLGLYYFDRSDYETPTLASIGHLLLPINFAIVYLLLVLAIIHYITLCHINK